MTYTDVNGNSLVGYFPTFTTSSNSTVAVGQGGTPVSTATSFTSVSFLVTGTTIAGADTYCGVAAGTATLSGATLAGEIAGNTGAITRTQAITVTGVPATIALTASPAAIACDGTATSTVTAKVTDSAGNNVVDNTPITFSVVALGTANPINTTTKGGTATSVITPLSGSTSGVVVTVTSGSAASSIRIDCTPSLASPTAPAGGPGAATATPVTGVRGPNTGTGGYLGQNGSAGFPMWTLVALALGSMALVAGGVVTRRAGK
jgi:adhesin/invasin